MSVGGDVETMEKLRRLKENVLTVIQKTRGELKKDVMTPASVRELVDKKTLTPLEIYASGLTDPRVSTVVWIIGTTRVGKSRLINELAGKEICKVGEKMGITPMQIKNGYQKLEVPLTSDASEPKLVIYDTMGFGDGRKPKEYLKIFKKLVTEKRNPDYAIPDVIIMCGSKNTFEVPVNMKEASGFMKELRKMVKNETKCEVPVLLVHTKVDEACPMISGPDRLIPAIRKHVADFGPGVCGQMGIDPECFFGTAINDDAGFVFGVTELRAAFNSSVALQKQLAGVREGLYNYKCRQMAMQIIAGFSGANAAISLLPLVDIPITFFTTQLMVKILAAFSRSERDENSFGTMHGVLYGCLSAVRVFTGVAGFALEMTVVGLAAGTALQMGSSFGITELIGWKAFDYYMETDPKKLAAEKLEKPKNEKEPLIARSDENSQLKQLDLTQDPNCNN